MLKQFFEEKKEGKIHFLCCTTKKLRRGMVLRDPRLGLTAASYDLLKRGGGGDPCWGKVLRKGERGKDSFSVKFDCDESL